MYIDLLYTELFIMLILLLLLLFIWGYRHTHASSYLAVCGGAICTDPRLMEVLLIKQSL